MKTASMEHGGNGMRWTSEGTSPPPASPAAAGPCEAWPSDGERLCAAARLALLTPRRRAALVLRLSALPPPLPRPHHRRIAATILEKAARLHDGEVFEMPDGDIVLLCGASGEGELHPKALPEVLGRLLRADVPPTRSLATVWNLERDGAALLAYTAALEGRER